MKNVVYSALYKQFIENLYTALSQQTSDKISIINT